MSRPPAARFRARLARRVSLRASHRARLSPRFHSRLDSRAGGEDGQIAVLIIGYLLVSLLVVTVVMGASALYLGHKRLLSTADGAALAAADTFSLGPAGGAGGGPAAVLSPAAVQAEVNRYLEVTDAGARLPGLTVAAETGTADGRTARVVLTGVVHPPLVNFLVPDGIPITAAAEARARLSQ